MRCADPLVVSIEVNQECALNCPYCYSRPRRRGCRWEPGLLLRLVREAVALTGETVVVLGDGEPLLSPRLTGLALRAALDAGACHAGFTTSGVPRQGLGLVEGWLGLPPGSESRLSLTLSLDYWKLALSPRVEGAMLTPVLERSWSVVRGLLPRSRGGGVPEPLAALVDAWRRGWRIALNLLVDVHLPVTGQLALAAVRDGIAEQVNLLAPKLYTGLLPGSWQHDTARTLRALLGKLFEEGVRVAVDPAMRQYLLGEPGCRAGLRLLSVNACGRVRPYSFHSGPGMLWTPGRLGSIWSRTARSAGPLRGSWCPYSVLPRKVR